VLNYLFTSCDRFCDDPELFEDGDVTEKELLADAENALSALWNDQAGLPA
jgi:hypothetical protein